MENIEYDKIAFYRFSRSNVHSYKSNVFSGNSNVHSEINVQTMKKEQISGNKYRNR